MPLGRGQVKVEKAVGRVKALARRVEPYHLKYEKARDHRAIFAFVYYRLTIDIAAAFEEGRPAFDDPTWIADLAEVFAHRFLKAMDDIDAAKPGKSVWKPWADVNRAIQQNQSLVLEDLVFGLVAHIGCDLPYALLKVDHSLKRMGDYHRMNALLTDSVQSLIHEVGRRYEPFLLWLDQWVGYYAKFLTSEGIEALRSAAWYNAMRLLSPTARRDAEKEIEGLVELTVETLRRPRLPWLWPVLALLRWILGWGRKWPQNGV